MSGPKTVAEARALPEITWEQKMRAYFGSGFDGDGVLAFTDDDGLLKQVACIRRSPDGPDEWVKVR